MEEYRIGVAALTGSAAAFLAWRSYPGVGIAAALLVLFLSSWIIYRFTSPDRALGTFSYLQSPPIAGFIGFSAVFIRLSVGGASAVDAFAFGAVAALLSGALSMVVFSIWNPG